PVLGELHVLIGRDRRFIDVLGHAGQTARFVAFRRCALTGLFAEAVETISQILVALDTFGILARRNRRTFLAPRCIRFSGFAFAACGLGVADVLRDEPFERAPLGIVQRGVFLNGVQRGVEDFQRFRWIGLDKRHGFLDRVADVALGLL